MTNLMMTDGSTVVVAHKPKRDTAQRGKPQIKMFTALIIRLVISASASIPAHHPDDSQQQSFIGIQSANNFN